jgi:hypothetical protein
MEYLFFILVNLFFSSNLFTKLGFRIRSSFRISFFLLLPPLLLTKRKAFGKKKKLFLSKKGEEYHHIELVGKKEKVSDKRKDLLQST